jgi:uridylate kinase
MNTKKNKVIKKTYEILVIGSYRVTDLIEAKSSKEAKEIANNKYVHGFYDNDPNKERWNVKIYEHFVTKKVEYI